MHRLTLREYKVCFDKLYHSLCLFANKYVDDIDMAKDIVQDVFIRVWENKIEFRDENNVKSFLYTSVKNKSLDYLKSKRYKTTKKISVNDIELLETESFFLREVVVVETSNIIQNAINTLPNRCAQIIKLSVKNFTNAEIAEELNISIYTVKVQKRTAYKRLRPILKNHFALIAFIWC